MTDPRANEQTPAPPAPPAPPPLPPVGQFAPPPAPIAGGQPGGGPQPVLPVMPYGGYAPYWVPPQKPPENPQAKKLVLWSHILGWGGVALFLVGSVAGSVVLSAPAHDPTVLIIGAGGGFAIAAVGGILGQIGRAMQGRVV